MEKKIFPFPFSKWSFSFGPQDTPQKKVSCEFGSTVQCAVWLSASVSPHPASPAFDELDKESMIYSLWCVYTKPTVFYCRHFFHLLPVTHLKLLNFRKCMHYKVIFFWFHILYIYSVGSVYKIHFLKILLTYYVIFFSVVRIWMIIPTAPWSILPLLVCDVSVIH